jgi:hypothetical protein
MGATGVLVRRKTVEGPARHQNYENPDDWRGSATLAADGRTD